MRHQFLHQLRKPGVLHWLLAWTVIAQAAIPLQAHTTLARGDTGQVVVLCTWTGTRTVAFGEPEAPSGDTVERTSPACLFSQLLSAATATADVPVQQPAFVPVATIVVGFDSQFQPEARRTHAIRGPPTAPIMT